MEGREKEGERKKGERMWLGLMRANEKELKHVMFKCK
jgi:hypothetical protein